MIIKDVRCTNPKCYAKDEVKEVFLRRLSDSHFCEYCGDQCETVLAPNTTIYKGEGWFKTNGKY